MADIEKSIAECCKQLKLSTNFAGQAYLQKGDTPQEYLLNLLTNEIEYRTAKMFFASTFCTKLQKVFVGRCTYIL